jgi:hypothetical protein
LFPFLSWTIFVTFHCGGSLPCLNDVKKRVRICCYRTGHTSLHTLMVSPSLPAARSVLAENNAFSISSPVSSLMESWPAPISPMRPGLCRIRGSGKKLCRSSSAIPALSCIIGVLAWEGGIKRTVRYSRACGVLQCFKCYECGHTTRRCRNTE